LGKSEILTETKQGNPDLLAFFAGHLEGLFMKTIENDGVKVNYCKFGTALKKIAGLDAQDD
jgi:hypothetical protein